jgi:eukaryotic-like serine/threonine-protein kinase
MMPNAHLVAPGHQQTPVELKSSRGSPRGIPEDLLRAASRRLGIMSLLGAALWFVGTLIGHITYHEMSGGNTPWLAADPTDVFATASIVVSLALFAFTRRSDRDPKLILDLGLGYMIFTAMALGLVWHWGPVPKDWSMQPMISWIGVALLMFAAIVPNSPKKIFVAGIISVAMNPLAMLLAGPGRGLELGSKWNVLLMHYPDFLLVGVAVVIAHVVTNLGQQVSKAREMGSYQLGELLGRGGMGEVYRATHRMLARPAAIKLIRPEMLGAVDTEAAQLAVKRFHREATSAANLRSPHTVELYDFGVTDDQTLYFVMEMLEGMNLETLVRQHGPLPPARVVHILRQVCESLGEAHAAGLVHRDIKPANIHVGRLGLREDFVKVLDFGLVKSIKSPPSEQSLGTAVGNTPGTPAYMAPEMGLNETVDGRADIYALGCVAYYMLTGRLVFEAENSFQMLAQHLQKDPVPPSERAGVEIPSALEKLVLACLAKKPEDRPQTAGELDQQLAKIEITRWSAVQAADWWSETRSAEPLAVRT